MTRPTVSRFAEELYENCVGWAYADEQNGWALLHLCEAIARPYRLTDAIANPPVEGRGPWETLLDIDHTPPEFLPWLGQFVGIQPAQLVGLDEGQQRDFIRACSAYRRGTPAAMIAAAQIHLAGSRTIFLNERAGSAYQLRVATWESETPVAAAVERALISQKPAGIVMHYETIVGGDYETLLNTHTDYADVKAQFADYDAVRNDPADT